MATIKEKAALGRAKTKKELEEIAELLAIAGEGVGRVTRSDIANKLKQIGRLNRAAEGKSRLDKLVNNARKVVKNRMTKDDSYKMDDNKIVPKPKPPRDIKPKPKPPRDIKPTLKLKPPRDTVTLAKGGMVKGYMGGGEVHMDDSPNSGMITQRGWGASKKT